MKPPLPFAHPVYVTRPLLPPLEDYSRLLEQIWESGWLTNAGAQHEAFEAELANYLQADHLSLFNNGTLALMVACQALGLAGEVITTPFTFPATPHVLSWNRITPVFADIDPATLCIDPGRIESCITARTSAILGVHVYGVPCDVVAIDDIARRHGLRVLYDAAHAFGTAIEGNAIAQYGDATMFSLHATKLFHSAEGGALAMRDPALKRQADLLKNFGIANEDEVRMAGINGKMSELHAALGRVVLPRVVAERRRRARVREIYAQRLAGCAGVRLHPIPAGVTDSYQYLVLRINADEAGCSRDVLHARLKRYNIVTRKYFKPLCSEYDCYRQLPSAEPGRLPVAYRIASEVLTLPFHGMLGEDDVQRICDAILYSLKA